MRETSEWPGQTRPIPRLKIAGIESMLIEMLRQVAPCPVRIDDVQTAIQDSVNTDVQIAADLHDGGAILRVWRNDPCVVASRRQSMLTGFSHARSLSEASGWPIAVRRSGGTAVVHRPGILNISLISAQGAVTPIALDASYIALLEVMRDAMALLGIVCDYGEVPGAHCDGRYNLKWHGQKIAGTAGWVTHGSTTRRVYHASLQLGGAIGPDLEAIHRFEAALGEPVPYDTAAHTTVERILAARHNPLHAVK
ncbi:hypothetical protein D3Y57_03705 (plasmid) [Sphingomonas paeninsulae]|uniref:BPL/LPL catalytic domain-containing protein n=1 Tax=Sphingomonas paeninsulae TaxID=2319844 RepID=A0A494TH25_SPHPE|nr:hypothetical protein D3Y57_03705 [Sphingomonas paeninsulae]